MSRRRGAAPQKAADPNRWLVSYADFITVMMVFFIVLWTTARIDTGKFQELGQAMSVAFFPSGNLLPEPGLPGAGGLGTGESDEPPSEDATDDEDWIDPDLGTIAWPVSEEWQWTGVHPWTGLPIPPEDVGYGLLDELPELVESGEMSVVQTERGIVISLQNSVLFDSGSADIRTDAVPILREVALALEQTDRNILVEGYTDNVPIQTAAFPSNWELSAARATNVLRHLLAVGDLDPDRFAAVGYGEYRNIYPNDSEENRQKNRRVDIVILDERTSLNVGQELKPAR